MAHMVPPSYLDCLGYPKANLVMTCLNFPEFAHRMLNEL